MQIVAGLTGIIVGGLVGWRIKDFCLLLAYLQRYRLKTTFTQFYELHDGEDSYKSLKLHVPTVKSYAQYLKLHQEARPKAYVIFRDYYTQALRYTAWPLLVLLLVGLVFGSNIATYSICSLSILVVIIALRRIQSRRRADFYTRSMMSAILAEFYEQKA